MKWYNYAGTIIILAIIAFVIYAWIHMYTTEELCVAGAFFLVLGVGSFFNVKRINK